MTKSCIIVIPVYKKEPSDSEKASLEQCLKILGKYDLCFIAPKSLDITNYKNILDRYNKTFTVELFADKNFKSLISYSKLMLTKDFYKRFLKYDKMLIYQLDAWIFKDDLDYWCEQPYDYIGAPWFEGFDSNITPDTKLQKYAGNGGFSLRSIDKMYKLVTLNTKSENLLSLKDICKKYKKKKQISNILNFPLHCIKWLFQEKRFLNFWLTTELYEDVAINYMVQKKYSEWFKLAPSDVAIKFSFELQPEVLFKMNNSELPFGCHAFQKYNWDFWKNYINL